MKVLALVAVAFAVNLAAHADGFTVNSGKYGTEQKFYGEGDSYRITMEGSRISVTDSDNQIVYSIDTANPNEQELAPKLLEHLRTKPGARTIAGMVDKVTVSGMSVDPAGVMRGQFNIYIDNKTVFGTVKAKLSVGAQVQNTPCEITHHVGYDPKDYKPIDNVYTGSCIKAELGTTFGVQSLEALTVGGKAFASDIISAVGMTADTIFKFYSPVMTGLISLYESR